MKVEVPINWKPRDYQRPLWDALEGGCKRAVAVWHRRAGKDIVSLNYTITQAFLRPGLYWHVLPTYKQGRKIVWEGMTKDGRDFLSCWPQEAIVRQRDDEMSLWLDGGSLWQVVGTDDVDRLVGANPVGVVFSEYSLQEVRAWNLIRPILAENDGWAIFIYTPRGRNHGYRTYKMAEDNEKWFCELLTVDDTKAVSQDAIDDERAAGMPEELIQQEFYCSFDAPLVGAYYGPQMGAMQKEDRICKLPWEPTRPVITAWDLGIGDATAIWFCQQVGQEIRLIDFYSSSGVGLEHYAKILKEKPYAYQENLVPHDATVRELGSGKSRLEIARTLGIQMRVVQKLPIEDGIGAVRALLPRCWTDEKKCEKGLQALREYTKERVEGETDPDGNAIFRDKPRHDWTSHAADALRTLAIGLRPIRREKHEILAPKLAIV